MISKVITLYIAEKVVACSYDLAIFGCKRLCHSKKTIQGVKELVAC